MFGGIVPVRCGGCGALLVRRPAPRRAWPPLLAPAAPGGATAWCEHCRDRWGEEPGWWTPAPGGCPGWSAAEYRGPVRRAILLAKRGAPEAAAALLFARLPAALTAQDAAGAWVTWVPGHRSRVLTAPDAGVRLAQVVAGALAVECRAALRRDPRARRQAGLADEDRLGDPARLGLVARGALHGHALLVDDVRTTGATLDRAAHVLRCAGAASVTAIVVASSPRKR